MEISLTTIKDKTSTFLHRYHAVIFTVIVAGGLILVIFLLNNIIASSSTSTNYTPAGSDATFDEATIERVNQLKSSEEASEQLNLSQRRINPFVE